jgi:hypothetical protein
MAKRRKSKTTEARGALRELSRDVASFAAAQAVVVARVAATRVYKIVDAALERAAARGRR